MGLSQRICHPPVVAAVSSLVVDPKPLNHIISSNFTPLHALPPLRTDVAVGSVWVGRPIPTLKRLREWMRLCFGHLGILASFSARIWSLDLFVFARGFGGTVLGIMIKGHRGVSESCLTTLLECLNLGIVHGCTMSVSRRA